VEMVGSPSAALLLRLKATVGGDDPEVLGACYNGIIHLDGRAAIPWVSRFLASADDAAAEAALAIAGDRSPQAFTALHERFLQAHDPWFQAILLSAIGLTRQQAALDFLLQLVRTESPRRRLPSRPSSVNAANRIIKQLESMFPASHASRAHLPPSSRIVLSLPPARPKDFIASSVAVAVYSRLVTGLRSF